MITETKEMRPVDWLYIGYDWDGKRLMHRWDDNDGMMHRFAKNLLPLASPGAYFTVHTDGEMVRTGNGDQGPKYLRVVEDREGLAALQLASRTAQIQARMAKAAKNDMSQDRVDEILAPLKFEYAKRNHTGKAALIAEVILQLQGWR